MYFSPFILITIGLSGSFSSCISDSIPAQFFTSKISHIISVTVASGYIYELLFVFVYTSSSVWVLSYFVYRIVEIIKPK